MKLVRVLAMSVLGVGFLAGATLAQVPARGAGRAAPAAAGRAGRAGALRAAAGDAAGAPLAARGGGRAAAAADKPRLAATRPATPAGRVDQREANQQRRIDAGVNKGQLTSDEVERLQGMEINIDTLEASFKSDGKLNKDEVKQLRGALNDASLQIWSERHDTEGNQKPVMRLGKEVFAQDQLTSKLESDTLTKAEAKAFLEDFRKMVNIKRRLASDNLTAEQRTKLQADYDVLLNQYFLVK